MKIHAYALTPNPSACCRQVSHRERGNNIQKFLLYLSPLLSGEGTGVR